MTCRHSLALGGHESVRMPRSLGLKVTRSHLAPLAPWPHLYGVCLFDVGCLCDTSMKSSHVPFGSPPTPRLARCLDRKNSTPTARDTSTSRRRLLCPRGWSWCSGVRRIFGRPGLALTVDMIVLVLVWCLRWGEPASSCYRTCAGDVRLATLWVDVCSDTCMGPRATPQHSEAMG